MVNAETISPGQGRKPSVFSLAMSIYLPCLLTSIAGGAVAPFLPLFAEKLGANFSQVGTIVGLGAIGVLMFDIPAGLLTSKIGNYRIQAISMPMVALLAFLTAFSNGLVMLGTLKLLSGAMISLWSLARLTYLRSVIPVHMRGRGLSLLGGSARIGLFFGAIAGGYISEWFGFRALFLFQGILIAMGFVFFLWQGHPTRPQQSKAGAVGLKGIGKIFIRERKVFATAGTCMLILSLLRSARYIIIPLWSVHIGLDKPQIGLVFGLSSAIDMVMFIPAGHMMDHVGRRLAAIISTGGIAAGFLLIPLTGSFGSLLAVCMMIGFTNGMGSGINMTLTTDFAPDDEPEKFTALWRLIGDTGSSVGPPGIGFVAQVLTLATSAALTGCLGLAGVVFILFALPETLKRKIPPPIERNPNGT